MSEEAAPATESPEASAPETPQEEFLEYTANGQRIKAPKAEVLRKAALADGAWQKFEEASKLRKETEERFQKAISSRDPQKVASLLKEMGYDPREFGEQYLRPIYEKEMASPEERARIEFEEQKRQVEAEKLRIEEMKRTEQEQREFLQAKQQMGSIITQAITSTPDLPQTPYTVQRMAYWMQAALNSGASDITMQDVVNQVRSEYRSDSSLGLERMTPDQLLEFLGEEKIKAIEQARLAKLSRPRQVPPQFQRSSNQSKSESIADKKVSSSTQYEPW